MKHKKFKRQCFFVFPDTDFKKVELSCDSQWRNFDKIKRVWKCDEMLPQVPKIHYLFNQNETEGKNGHIKSQNSLLFRYKFLNNITVTISFL